MVLPAALPLGPFDLGAPLARGGMGTVWQAVHRALGVPVAIKIVDPGAGEDFARALEHEVRAVAGLDHPHIIRVWDQGRVDRAAARASEGRLEPRSAWFAMELADRGKLRLGLPWSRLRPTLLELLGALAHAHAHGVLHRDIKPGNVLFASDPAGAPVLKLSDFGMGFRLDGATAPVYGGTPHWMAPEQFLGDLALQGPWTDLYSVGCLAWALLAGRPPFRVAPPTSSDHLHELAAAHLQHPFPPLPIDVAVPDGFDAWLAGLVAKDPGARWPAAADAIAALSTLPATVEGEDAPLPDDRTDEAPTVTRFVLNQARGAVTRSPSWSGPSPPCPEDWRSVGAPRGASLRGAGLGLYGLRSIPLVGRVAEQDACWAALRAVHDDGQTRLILVQGGSGLGKSRLAEWLATTADEAGAAGVIRAAHAPEQSLRDGLPGLVARHYRVGIDANRSEVEAQVARRLGWEGERDEDEAERIARLLRPDRGAPEVQTADQRIGLVERLARRLAMGRPLVVWLDDVHHSAETLRFVRRVVDGAAGRLLVIATVLDDALDERPAIRSALAEIAAAAGDRLTRLSLAPLSSEAQGALVQGLLGLTGELAARVEARTEGNPLFAVQLVGDWVERERLVPTPHGFHLVASERSTLPDSIAQLWERRVAGLVRRSGDKWRFPLELAAVLGREIDRGEWETAAGHAGLRIQDALVTRLVEQRLMQGDPENPRRLTFAHGMLRESLLDAAVAAGRAERWHRAAAAMVRARGGPEADERAGRHLLVAGDVDAAAPFLLTAVHDRTHAGEAAAALEIAAMLDAALPDRGCVDPCRAELTVLRAQALRILGHLAEARALVDPYTEVARALPPRIRAYVLREHALARLHTAGVSDELYQWLADARTAAVEAEAPTLAADLDVEEARALEYHGRVADAGAAYARALAVYEAHADRSGEGDARLGLASVANKEGRYAEASAHAAVAMDRLCELRATWRVLYAKTLLGEIARYRGRLDDAEALYREVIWYYERLVSRRQTALPRTNLALVLLETGRYDEAAATLAEAAEDAGTSGHVNLGRMVQLIAVWAEAGRVAEGRGDGAAVDHGLEMGEALLADRVVDLDLARAAERAAALLGAAGDRRRARWAAFLASRMYAALGQPNRAAQVAGG